MALNYILFYILGLSTHESISSFLFIFIFYFGFLSELYTTKHSSLGLFYDYSTKLGVTGRGIGFFYNSTKLGDGYLSSLQRLFQGNDAYEDFYLVYLEFAKLFINFLINDYFLKIKNHLKPHII